MGKLVKEEPYAKPKFFGDEKLPCRDNPDAFWLEDKDGEGLRGEARRTAIRLAKTYCYECPVRLQCLGFAVRTHQTGVWGGTTDEERRPRNFRKPASAGS